jgi:transposase-like protein
MILNNSEEEGICPKCKGDLEFNGGSNMETENWHCNDCNSSYSVQVEMVRFWDTLKEVEG